MCSHMKKTVILFCLIWTTCASTRAQQLNIATYNLRYENDGDTKNGNGWATRMPVIADLVRFHDFDIFGTQEGLQQPLNDLNAALKDYSYIGAGRDDSKDGGEHAAIFYKTAKFSLIRKGNFWLSEITDRPNRGWDAVLPRICSWGAFQDRSSNRIFYFFNTHFDHIGVKARRESAKLILRKISEIAGQHPAILTGDFNVDQTNEIYTILSGSFLTDAYQTAEIRYATNGTINHFNINTKTNSRIDHLFLSSCIKPKRYGILTDSYRTPAPDTTRINTSGNFPKEIALENFQARLSSDHFPVMVVIDLSDCK